MGKCCRRLKSTMAITEDDLDQDVGLNIDQGADLPDPG